jgi:hypothetical protein
MIFYFKSDQDSQNIAITRHLEETARLKTLRFLSCFLRFAPKRGQAPSGKPHHPSRKDQLGKHVQNKKA